MLTEFSSLALAPMLQATLVEEGYLTPTPIQAKAIGPILEGRDMLGCAQTGTGKTAAFALPILTRLVGHVGPGASLVGELSEAKPKPRGARRPRVLVLAPTRELVSQIGDSFRTYGRGTGLRGTAIYGGVSQHPQVRGLKDGSDVIIAAPGRLMDLMEQGHVDLSGIEIFVLDEADRMLDMGFIDPIRFISSQLPTKRQTLMFSATMPKEIMRLADSLLREPVKVSVAPTSTTAETVEQHLYMVPRRGKQLLLEHLLDEHDVQRAVVFTKTKHGADRVFKQLDRSGIEAVAIHGNKAQNYRTRALSAFKAGKVRVLVATDVAARGLDVDGISHVFNFDLPMEPEAYVHRIGRTGRAGATGIAISFCDGAERDLLRQIERVIRKPIPVVTLDPLVQQEIKDKMDRIAQAGPDEDDRPERESRGSRFTPRREDRRRERFGPPSGPATATPAPALGQRERSEQGSSQSSSQGSSRGDEQRSEHRRPVHAPRSTGQSAAHPYPKARRDGPAFPAKPGFAKPGFAKPGFSKPGFAGPGRSSGGPNAGPQGGAFGGGGGGGGGGMNGGRPSSGKPGFAKPGFAKPGFAKRPARATEQFASSGSGSDGPNRGKPGSGPGGPGAFGGAKGGKSGHRKGPRPGGGGSGGGGSNFGPRAGGRPQ